MRSSIGLSYAGYCKRTVSGSTVTFDDGVLLPGVVQADISITRDNVQKYADNKLIFEISNFRQGTLTLTEAQFADDDDVYLTGNTAVSSVVHDLGNPDPPYVGFGMIQDTIAESSGEWEKSYTAVFLPKVKFAVADSSAQTRGESTSFSDPQLVGTIYEDVTGEWRRTQSFSTFAAAQSWLNTLMDISA